MTIISQLVASLYLPVRASQTRQQSYVHPEDLVTGRRTGSVTEHAGNRKHELLSDKTCAAERDAGGGGQEHHVGDELNKQTTFVLILFCMFVNVCL